MDRALRSGIGFKVPSAVFAVVFRVKEGSTQLSCTGGLCGPPGSDDRPLCSILSCSLGSLDILLFTMVLMSSPSQGSPDVNAEMKELYP